MKRYRPPKYERNNRGWRVPRGGTKSEAIYLMMMRGMSRAEITEELDDYSNTIGVLMWKICHPDESNEATYRHARSK